MKKLVLLAIIVVAVGAVGTGAVKGNRALAWLKYYVYKGKGEVLQATQVTSPAARDPGLAAACRNNLRHIENAKRKVAQERDRATGRMTWEDIRKEFPKGQIPRCPAGGEYVLGDVGMMPKCTLGSNGTVQPEDDHFVQNY